MGFDGLDGDAEVVGDLLVETAVDDALENLLLARRELGEQGFIETAAFLLHVAFTGFAEHALDELLEGGLLEGFFDEVDGAALEGVHGHGYVSVARDEDDGQLGLAGQKVFLHFKTTHARHAHVKHENRNGLRVVLGDEALAAVVELDAVVARLEEPLQGVADGVVIVDDIDRAQCFRGFGTVVIGKHERNLSSEKVS